MRPLLLVLALAPFAAATFAHGAKPDPAAVLAPHLDDATLFIAHLDAAKLEPAKVAAFLTKTGFVSRDADRKALAELVRQADALLAAARAKGAGSIYLVGRFDSGLGGRHQALPFLDLLVVCPLGAGADPAGLVALIPGHFLPLASQEPDRHGLAWRWQMKDGALVAGKGAFDQRWANRKPSPRPDLLAALAKADGAVASVALALAKDQARVFLEMMPRLPSEIGGHQTKMLLDGCAAATLSLDQEKPALRLAVTSVSPFAATELEKWLKERYAQLLALPETRKEAPFLVGAECVLLPKAQGAGLVLELDAGDAKLGALVRNLRDRMLANRGAMLAGSHMRQILIAMHNYHGDYNKLPDDIKDKDGKPLLSWRVRLLPYLEGDQLYREFKLDEPWDSPHNLKLLPRMPNAIRRPSDTAPLLGGEEAAAADRTPFLAPLGFGSAWSEDKPLTLGKLTQGDGTSNTVALVEVDDARMVPWTKPDDWRPTEQAGAKELHAWPDGRVNLAFFDASVRRAKPTMPFKILKQLIGWQDGLNEDIGPWFGR